MNTHKLVVSTLKKSKLNLLLTITTLLVDSLLVAIFPYLFKLLIDNAIPSKNYNLLTIVIIGLTLVPIFRFIVKTLQTFIWAKIGLRVSYKLRKYLFKHIVNIPIVAFYKIGVGETINRLTSACGCIGDVFIALQLLPNISNLFLSSVAIGIMFYINLELSIISIIIFPIVFLTSKSFEKKIQKLHKNISDLAGIGNSILKEVFDGIKTIKAFVAYEFENTRWKQWAIKHNKARSKIIFYNGFAINLFTESVSNLITGIVFGVGAISVINSKMTIGELVAFIGYLPYLFLSLNSLIQFNLSFKQASVAGDKIDELLKIPVESHGKDILELNKNKTVEIEFKDVSFSYGRRDFELKKINFKVKAGQILTIIGPTGSGKSTIVDLLLGFYRPRFGNIYVNKHDFQTLDLNHYRNDLAYIPQDLSLWDNSIYYNLVYPNNNVKKEEILQCVEDSELLDFIKRLPDGLETEIGNGGSMISGGELECIAIYRALLNKRRLLIFDEPAVGLDIETELKFMELIKSMKGFRTVILITHNLRYVKLSDQIVFIKKGLIVEKGSPKELLKNKGRFYDFYTTQLPNAGLDRDPGN